MHDISEETREAVAFVGETLGPLFLYEPTDAAVSPMYEALSSLDGAAASEWPFATPADAEHAFGLIERGLGPAADDDDELLWEFRRLFVGPMKKVAPPWGSVYTDRECVVFGLTTLELRQWMRRNSISRLDHDGEPEDHIGLMLLLMAWIARERPELLDEYLTEHLLTWAPHFLGIVEREAQHPFLQGLAYLTRSSLQGMQAVRKLDVAVPRFYR